MWQPTQCLCGSLHCELENMYEYSLQIDFEPKLP